MAEPSKAEAQPDEIMFMEEPAPQYAIQAPEQKIVQMNMCGGLSQQTDFTKGQTYAD